MLAIDGEELRARPLFERRRRLLEVMKGRYEISERRAVGAARFCLVQHSRYQSCRDLVTALRPSNRPNDFEECLNVHWFASIGDAQQKIDAFQWASSSRSSQGSPREFAERMLQTAANSLS